MRCWCGYLFGARFTYGPADVTATPSSLASLKFWCIIASPPED